MQIGLIGEGAIGRYVMEQLRLRGLRPQFILTRSDHVPDHSGDAPTYVRSVSDLPSELTLMVDCAGHSALAQHGASILERGTDLVTLSLGALADETLAFELARAAERGSARLHLASGAIGALDCLRAAKVGGLETVTYTGRKPPEGWKGSAAENVLDLDSLQEAAMHFQGNARDAAVRYPKNANVAAAVALAGQGFDETCVELIAEPTIASNIHEVHASGAFGSFHFRIAGQTLPDNPRSSALAAMSAVAAIEREIAAITT